MWLRQVKSVVEFGDWAANRGYIVGEGPDPYGPISPTAHSDGSLHYSNRALDINYRSGREWDSEREALTWLYHKVHRFKRFHKGWPLDELFFNGFGFIKEYGVKVNYPISHHEDHLHIGFIERRW